MFVWFDIFGSIANINDNSKEGKAGKRLLTAVRFSNGATIREYYDNTIAYSDNFPEGISRDINEYRGKFPSIFPKVGIVNERGELESIEMPR